VVAQSGMSVYRNNQPVRYSEPRFYAWFVHDGLLRAALATDPSWRRGLWMVSADFRAANLTLVLGPASGCWQVWWGLVVFEVEFAVAPPGDGGVGEVALA